MDSSVTPRARACVLRAALLAGLVLGSILLAPARGIADAPRLRQRPLALHALAGRTSTQALALSLVAACCAGLLALRGRRRRGDVAVAIEYPAEWSGSFTVRLLPARGETRPSRRPGAPITARRSSRTTHHGVSKETHFRRVRSGVYRIAVEGELRDRKTNALQREPFEVQEVELRENQTVRTEFDLRPTLCPVSVAVLWNRQPAKDVQVALFGQLNTLRYARKGVAQLGLPPGEHRVLAGSGDRVAERELRITDLQPRTVEIDLGQGEVVFKGCPHAVTPYLAGDLSAAARALEREGQTELAGRLEARLQESMGHARRAATLYREAGDWANAVRLLERITRDDSHYADACEMLADYFETEGFFDQATQKVEEALGAASQRPHRRDLHERLAGLYERCDELARALEILERLREEHPEREGLRTRIETLRKRMSLADAAELGSPESKPGASRYEILEQIGAGGMGVVFRARDRRLGREVALKRLAENLRDNPTALQLVQREARAAAALNHPNIVTLFDADEEDGRFFITMELLRGHPLSARLRKQRRFPFHEVALLGRQVAAGLEYAHARGVIHRDIKPGNLFLTDGKVLKIMDFGLAKGFEEVRKQATLVAGTPCYMSPEQTTRGAVGPPADVYALGVTLFELLVGQVPFPEGDVVQHHRNTPAPDPRERIPELTVPHALAALILEMRAKRPAQRPDAAAVRASLEALA